ncbi:MAG TPA: hypothetical protein VF902_08970 [Coriobacteriia bacterium]
MPVPSRIGARVLTAAALVALTAPLFLGIAGCDAQTWYESEFKKEDRTVAVGQPADVSVMRIRMESRGGCDAGKRADATPAPADSYAITPSDGASVVGGSFVATKPGVYTVTAIVKGKPLGSVRMTVGGATPEPPAAEANPLAGKWTWTEWWVSQKWDPQNGVTIDEWVWKLRPQPTVFDFVERDGGVFATGGFWPEAKVTLEGNNVSFVLYVKSSNSPHWNRMTCTGVLDGDTITGSVLDEQSADPPLEAPPSHTAAWTAARVK